MWLDHRAITQVHRINETKHSVLQCVGGVMSVEMQAPKLLWLKEVSAFRWREHAHRSWGFIHCGSVCTKHCAQVCYV